MGLLSTSNVNDNITNYTKVEPHPSNGTIQSLIKRLKIERLECGGLTIHGVMVAAYCNIILIIMGCFFLGCGALLTAIAWRPQEAGEEWGYWRTRIAESKKTRIVGPSLIGIGVVMLGLGVGLCAISHKVKKGMRTVHMSEVKRALNFNYDGSNERPKGRSKTAPFKRLRAELVDEEERRDSVMGKEKRHSIEGMEGTSSIQILEELQKYDDRNLKMEERNYRPESNEDFYLEGSNLHVQAITGNLSNGGDDIMSNARLGRPIMVQQHSVDIASFPKKYVNVKSLMHDSSIVEHKSTCPKDVSHSCEVNSLLVEGFPAFPLSKSDPFLFGK